MQKSIVLPSLRATIDSVRIQSGRCDGHCFS